MSDIVSRLRAWRTLHLTRLGALLDEAADEIERLRLQPSLTDAEREAVAWCRENITAMAHPSSAFAHIHAATLRGLLERLK